MEKILYSERSDGYLAADYYFLTTLVYFLTNDSGRLKLICLYWIVTGVCNYQETEKLLFTC